MGRGAKGRDRSTAGARPAAFQLGWARVRAAWRSFSLQTGVEVRGAAHALGPYMTRAGRRSPCIQPMSRLLVVLALAQSVSGFLLPSPTVVSPALRAASMKAAAAPAARTRALAPQVWLRPGVRSGTCTRARFASSVRLWRSAFLISFCGLHDNFLRHQTRRARATLRADIGTYDRRCRCSADGPFRPDALRIQGTGACWRACGIEP